MKYPSKTWHFFHSLLKRQVGIRKSIRTKIMSWCFQHNDINKCQQKKKKAKQKIIKQNIAFFSFCRYYYLFGQFQTVYRNMAGL